MMPLLIFGLDTVVVAGSAWLGWCRLGPAGKSLVENTLGWGLLALAWVVGSGVLLGLAGLLGRSGFLLLHAVALAGLLAGSKDWRVEAEQGLDFLSSWGRLLRSRTAEGWAALGLASIMLLLGVLAAQAEPAVFDALTYRLSRIGQWLQDGSIARLPTDDPRLNYMPVGPDVVIAWLLGATREGFWLAPLSQWAGGVLLLGATFGLARAAGLDRLRSLGAVAVGLGLANVAVQFTTIQSDLFAAGVFCAAYVLWHRAYIRNEASPVAGIGVALAWSSKGTMLYLAPGAAIWVGWLVWRHRGNWRALRPTVAAAVPALLLLSGPGAGRNLAEHGSVFGPRAAVVLHHGEALTLAQRTEKLRLNLMTSAVQMFEPAAQPVWGQSLARGLGQALLPALPAEADRHLFLSEYRRRPQVEWILGQTEPDADVLSCGLLVVGLFAVGLLAAAWRGRADPGAPQILAWGGGVAAFVLMQHAVVQWHPWTFRFMVLAAPWLAVIAAWGLGRWPRRIQGVAWAVVVISSLQVFISVQWNASQAAWRGVTGADPGLAQSVYRGWRPWIGRLDAVAEPVRLALPINYPLAAFYRTDPARVIRLEQASRLQAETAEAAVATGGDGWLVVPAARFMGREGRVVGRTWLYNGDDDFPYNLAAYRKLREGERPPPMVYRDRRTVRGAVQRRELLVRTWAGAPLRLELSNTGAAAGPFTLRTPAGAVTQVLPPRARLLLEVPLPAEGVGPIHLDQPAVPDGAAGANITARIVP